MIAPMTLSVARTDAVLLIRPGTAGIIRDWTALVVGVNRGGHLEQLARAKLPKASIVAVDDNLSLPGVLTAGQVDAIVVDALEVAEHYQVAQVLSQDRKAYWVSPKAPGLADDLDAWLEARERDGSLNRWREQFLGKLRARELDPGLLRVIDLMGRRLMLMPAVAAAKQAGGRMIEDPVREEVVEKSTMRAAREAGLDEGAYLNLVRLQFAAAKMVQRAAVTAVPAAIGRSSEEGQRELTQVLRPAIDRIDRALLRELGRLPRLDARAEDLAAALRADAPVPGLDDGLLTRLGEAVLRIAAAKR
jgi:chorismate mutase